MAARIDGRHKTEGKPKRKQKKKRNPLNKKESKTHWKEIVKRSNAETKNQSINQSKSLIENKNRNVVYSCGVAIVRVGRVHFVLLFFIISHGSQRFLSSFFFVSFLSIFIWLLPTASNSFQQVGCYNGFHRCLPSFLLGFTRFSRFLTYLYWVWLGSTWFYLVFTVFLGFTGFNCVFPDYLLSFTGFYRD